MHTRPPSPTFAATMFGVAKAVRLRFDASGRGEPQGYTVTNPAESLSAAVTLSITAPASTGALTAPTPVTFNSMVWPAIVNEDQKEFLDGFVPA